MKSVQGALKSRISRIMDNTRTELRKLADVIGSNIVEKVT